MANIVGCEVISLENYYKSEQVKGFKYDEFSSLDLPLLFKVQIPTSFFLSDSKKSFSYFKAFNV